MKNPLVIAWGEHLGQKVACRINRNDSDHLDNRLCLESNDQECILGLKGSGCEVRCKV